MLITEAPAGITRLPGFTNGGGVLLTSVFSSASGASIDFASSSSTLNIAGVLPTLKSNDNLPVAAQEVLTRLLYQGDTSATPAAVTTLSLPTGTGSLYIENIYLRQGTLGVQQVASVDAWVITTTNMNGLTFRLDGRGLFDSLNTLPFVRNYDIPLKVNPGGLVPSFTFPSYSAATFFMLEVVYFYK